MLDRHDIRKALLDHRHARGNVFRRLAVHVHRKHRLLAALLGPAHHPAERGLAALGAEQARSF